MNKEDKKIFKAIKKSVRQHVRDNEGEFVPFTTSINGMCECIGHPEYAMPLKNRIWGEIDKHESYGDYVGFNLEHPDDLFLTSEAICIFGEILSCYFDERDISAIEEYIMTKNEIERIKIREGKLLKKFSSANLKMFIAEYKRSGTITGIPVDEDMCQVLSSELHSRSLLRLFRTPQKLDYGRGRIPF